MGEDESQLTADLIERPVDAVDLVPWTSPLLRTPSPVAEPTKTLAEVLERRMAELNGLGLSAVQIGVMARAFSLRSEPVSTFFNPRIVDVSEEQVLLEEGCLSFPGLILKVRRPRIIKARFQLVDGQYRTMKFDGMTARIVQHEIDHLDGITFCQRVSRLKLEMAVRRANKLGYRYTIKGLIGEVDDDQREHRGSTGREVPSESLVAEQV